MHAKKVIAGMALIALIIVFLGLYVKNDVKKASDELSNYIETIEIAIDESNWDKAFLNYGIFMNEWNKRKKLWTLVLEHTELDQIDSSCVKLENVLIEKNKVLSKIETASLKHYIGHIPKKEEFVIENIL